MHRTALCVFTVNLRFMSRVLFSDLCLKQSDDRAGTAAVWGLLQTDAVAKWIVRSPLQPSNLDQDLMLVTNTVATHHRSTASRHLWPQYTGEYCFNKAVALLTERIFNFITLHPKPRSVDFIYLFTLYLFELVQRWARASLKIPINSWSVVF